MIDTVRGIVALARADCPVLVPDAHAIGMIGVIRSLGRAGYPVHACANHPDALGLKSNFTFQGIVCPCYEDSSFMEWLDQYIVKQNIRVIVPSEGFLLAIRPSFSRYSKLLPIPTDQTIVYDCFSKSTVISNLLKNQETAVNVPATLVWEQGMPLPLKTALEQLDMPLFVKGDGVDDLVAGQNLVASEPNASAALHRLDLISRRYRRVMTQGFVPGQGIGVYFLLHEGKIIQEFMNRCLHEVPHTGGFCALRESWWHPAMMEDARRKVRSLRWEGVAMLEYRWDPTTDRFWFIELNARFWAALHLALYSGIDFPTMMIDLRRGEKVDPVETFEIGLQCRYTVPSEIGYVISRWKDPNLPILRKLASIAGWFARFFDPRIYSDLYFPKDRRLYFLQWRTFVKDIFRRAPTR